MIKPKCPVHVSAPMKLRELGQKAATGPYDEPNVKERKLFWRCIVVGCGRVREYIRVGPPKRARCIHCGGPLDNVNRHLIAVCKKCHNRQRQARFQAKKKQQPIMPQGRVDDYKFRPHRGIGIETS